MAGGGGKKNDNSEAVEKQYEYDMDAWAYQNANAQRKYNHDVLTNAANRRNQEEQALYKERSAGQQWSYQMEMREFQHNSRVAAYNKSEKMYGAQIGLNQRAASMAYENARNVNAERQNKLAFEMAQSSMALSKTAFKIEHEKSGKTLEHQSRRAKAAFDSQDNFVKGIQAKGAASATGQVGRSANKKYQSIVAEAGRAQAAMVDGLTRADSAYNLAMYGLDVSLEMAGADYNLQRKQQDYSKLSIMRAYDQNLKKIEFDQFSANMKADANRMALPGRPPAMPKPLSVPRALILDPPIPINSPEPIEGAVMSTGTSGSGGSGVWGGMMTGASMGAAGGWWGAGIGAVVGGIGGGLGLI